jgi:DNA-directed RNA polymerase specialized sigma24 family protein
MTTRRGPWTLDQSAFERLLEFLDADAALAGVKYEEIRHRLVKLFAWRGCIAPEDDADRTIDRVARRLMEGATITVTDPYQYFHGVALNVVREQWRAPEHGQKALDEAVSGSFPLGPSDDGGLVERQLACLDRCLARMVPRHRDLLLQYHGGDRHVARRRELARALDIPMNALRIRVHRLRALVAECVRRGLQGSGGETDRAGVH